jgi:glyoxylase-like metal-dependent hydrolase (beta-lactamase superfamily II)
MKITHLEILEDLFFIQRAYLNGNHFVYRSKHPILIDTGYISDFEETKASIKKLDVDLATVRLILSTHTHCDHVGGNRFIQELSGCDIALHRIGKYLVDTQDGWSTWWFKETVDLYFDGAYEKIYDSLLHGLLSKGMVKKKDGGLFTIVKP